MKKYRLDTRHHTEAINMVAQCYAPSRLRPGDEIIVSVASITPTLTLLTADGGATNRRAGHKTAA
ncbi:hypothetical protein KCP77_06710 [Salmonella enterica subsp. enterica]|nr:hypothetical protein KCP77_06710 [Salmonella enterica subsp. enterica]